MKTSNKAIFYWDANIFLTLLTEDKRDTDLFDGAENVLSVLSKKEAHLVTSIFTKTEVLRTKMKSSAEIIFNQILQRSNVTVASFDTKVSDLSREIRENKYGISKTLKSPDAIHLATSIIYKVNEFHTNDIDLLSLDGKITHPNAPKICRPPLPFQLKFI